MAKINYDAINFRNKDVDKFATKFNKDKEPKTTTDVNRNIFGRTTTYTQTGKDTDNTFKETVTDRKGRVRKESEGSYKEKSGDILKDNEVIKKYNKKGDLKKEEAYMYESPGGKDYSHRYSYEKKKNGEVVRGKTGIYAETNTATIDTGTRTNRRVQNKPYDRSTTNFNEKPLRRRR
jgi:hypothetical protein